MERIKLNPDLIGLIVSYVCPYELTDFFVANNLNFGMKFKYDLYDHSLSNSDVDSLFQYFPNMILIGLAINMPMFLDPICVLQLHDVIHLRIMGEYRYPLNLNAICRFPNCPNVKRIYIEDTTLHYLSFLLKYKKLRSIKVQFCIWKTEIPDLSSLLDLRTIKFPRSSLVKRDFWVLSRCLALRRLEITNYWRNDQFNFKNLRYLKIYDFGFTTNHDIKRDIKLSVFDGCTRLRTLNFTYCDQSIIHITPIKYKLRKLFLGHRGIHNMHEIINLKSLCYLNISSCARDINVQRLNTHIIIRKKQSTN